MISVLFYILDDSPTSELLCDDVSEHSCSYIFIDGITYEDGIDIVFRNVGT
jgi:hypothetical protein